MAYQIIRQYMDSSHPDHHKIVKEGLTMEEAQEHCRDEETREEGVWFDSYESE